MKTLITVLSAALLASAAQAELSGGYMKTSQTISRAGSQASTQGPDEWFTGKVTVEPLFASKEPSHYSGAYVSFEPGARSAWHMHPAGQHLIVTKGEGYTQEWGGPIVILRPGDTVWCPPGVKHWHGAATASSMTHIALTGTVDGKNAEWMEKVSDEDYAKAQGDKS